MEKNVILSQSKNGCGRTSSELAGTAFRPFERLRRYYSEVLEEEVSYSRMWRLINAQLAFVAAVFPADAPLLARALCAVWLVCSLLACRR